MNIKKKMNIAMVCDPIGNNKSGVIISTLRFSHLLKKRGHHIIFIAAKSKKEKVNSFYKGIKVYRFRSLPVPKSCGWNSAFPTIRELKKIFQQEKINIVHIILPMSGAIVAIKAARALNIKIIAHSHSQPENLFMEMPRIVRPTLDNLWNRYLIWLYSKSELLIYPSEMARSLLDKLSSKGQPSKVISNGINIKEFKPVAIGNFYNRFNIPNGKINLLFIGRLFPEKSVDTLIKAIPYIVKDQPNINVMIVGEGHLRTKLEKLVYNLGVSKYIIFLGLISKEDKVLAYNASDIFILPSLAELEGMVILEAMACGKPIIVSDAEMNASRFFVDKNGFLFKTKDYKDLAKKIIKLVMDANLREKMGKISLEKSKIYDINKSVDKLESVYYSLLKNL
ncbi:MAG: glycosyltransferase [Xanthomonadaceae bacterium]|nr:glycosyltransferase [Rhodospirillaceae bacterium]NIA18067.1 glycosyltransferase [Xanthomonadaceae bacterium]